MGIGGMKPAGGPEWDEALQAATEGERPCCPDCGRLLEIRRRNGIGEDQPVHVSASCHNCKKWISNT